MLPGSLQRHEPACYAVIFTSARHRADPNDGYEDAAARLFELAAKQPGFLGVDSAREGVGITVSYFADLASIDAWRQNVEHQEVQRRGRAEWYSRFTVHVARVERSYDFERSGSSS
jgi:heme-degrading monooxygenase HmoA